MIVATFRGLCGKTEIENTFLSGRVGFFYHLNANGQQENLEFIILMIEHVYG